MGELFSFTSGLVSGENGPKGKWGKPRGEVVVVRVGVQKDLCEDPGGD